MKFYYRVLPVLFVVALAIVGFQLFQQTGANMTFYYEVDEVQVKQVGDETIKISGIVGDGTISREPQRLFTQFDVTGTTNQFVVHYEGPVPDIFREGIQVVVEGAFRPDGVFVADNLMAKCPSKYEPSGDPSDFEHLQPS